MSHAFRAILIACLVGCTASASPQPTQRTYRIGYLSNSTQADGAVQLDAFRSAMRDIGYTEGSTFSLELRYSDGQTDRLPVLAAELVALGPDIIVTENVFEAQALKQATTTIAIVLAGVSQPIENGLAQSLAKPGGNITGTGTPAVTSRRMQVMKETVPGATRLGFIYNPSNSNQRIIYEEAQAAAPNLSLTLVPMPYQVAEDFAPMFAAASGARLDSLYLASSKGLILTQLQRLIDFSTTNRLPSIFGSRQFVDAGGLMFYGPDATEGVRGAALYVDRILKGGKPADLPIQMTSKFEFVINLKTARALGISIPKSVLDQATEFIQ